MSTAKQVKPEEIASGEAVVGLVNALAKTSMHTPGPWKAESFWSEIAIQAHELPAGDRAEITAVPRGSSVLTESEQMANAHLIAAAPEMLQALESSLFYIVHGGKPEEIEALKEYITMTLTKAKGE